MARGGIAAAFALGIAGGLLLGRLWKSPEIRTVVEVRERPATTSAHEEPALAADTHAPRAATTEVTEGGPSDAFPTPEITPAAPVEFPRLRVRVVDASGAPVEGGGVYALPARAPGTNEEDDVCSDYGQDEDFTLVLPGPGLYDVGAWSGTAHVLREDVTIPAAEPLVLRLPETVPVRFDAVPELASRLRTERPSEPPRAAEVDPVVVHFVPVTDSRAVEYPGRGETCVPKDGFLARISREAPSTTVPCPRGVRYRVDRVEGRIPVSVTPSEFVAPSAISVAPGGARVDFEMRFPSLSAAFGRPVAVLAHLSVEGLGDEVVAQETYGPAERLSRRPLHYGGWHVPVESGILTWRGPGLRPGRVAFQAGSDGEAKVVVDALVEGTLPTSPVDSRPGRSFRVVATEADPPHEV
jgi:hypothetical protein